MTGKVAFCYAIITEAYKQIVIGDVYFVSKDITNGAGRVALKIFKNRKLSKASEQDLVNLFSQVEAEKLGKDGRVSHEIMFYIALNYLVLEIADIQARNRFGHIPIITILDEMQKRWSHEMEEHYIYFSRQIGLCRTAKT